MQLPKRSVILLCIAAYSAAPALADPAADLVAALPSFPAPAHLPEIGRVNSRGRADNLIGKSMSASDGYVGYGELKNRPILRPAELLETVPGLVISQHSGEGKANQYYLRGFNLDHGTDAAISVQGIPANMRTHAHGQGYADVNWLIPEVVDNIRFQKGTYNAEFGDFATAGSVDMTYFNVLPKSIATVSTGTFGQARFLLAESPKVGANGHLLYAVEYAHVDNTARRPDNYRKYNGLLRYTERFGATQFGVTAQAYDAKWLSSDQIPLRAVQRGDIDRYGLIDPTDGGRTHRYVLSTDIVRDTPVSRTKFDAYIMDYGLDLYSNFTYFLSDPVNGDQFQQSDKRTVLGMSASHTWKTPSGETTLGYQLRSDNITPVALNATRAQTFLSTTRQSRVAETSNSLYVESAQRLSKRLRMTPGLRVDSFQFRVQDGRPENSGNVAAAIVSPKLAVAYAAGPATEFYADYGTGFHSNDARGVVQNATPLARAKGAEIGTRFAINYRVRSTVSIWRLDLASELVFVGDAGVTEAARPSRRNGVEFANFWTPSPGVTYDFDFSHSAAKFSSFDPSGQFIPGSIKDVLTFGATTDQARYFGSLRLRYFGPRPLIEDGSVNSKPTTTVNLQAGIKPRPNMRLSFDVFNLLNAKASDIDYYYNSSIPSDPGFTKPGYTGACPIAQCGAGVADIHFHPIVRRQLRVNLTQTW